MDMFFCFVNSPFQFLWEAARLNIEDLAGPPLQDQNSIQSEENIYDDKIHSAAVSIGRKTVLNYKSFLKVAHVVGDNYQ